MKVSFGMKVSVNEGLFWDEGLSFPKETFIYMSSLHEKTRVLQKQVPGDGSWHFCERKFVVFSRDLHLHV